MTFATFLPVKLANLDYYKIIPADSSIRSEQLSHKQQVLGSSPSQPTIHGGK